MERKYGFAALLAVVAVSIIFGMVLGGRLNTPRTMEAASGPLPSVIPPAANGSGLMAPDFADVVEASLPAVVGVSNTQVAKKAEADDDPHERYKNDPFFRFFFNQPDDNGDGRRPSPERRLGFASGFIISEDGYILTNNHVVEDAARIEVTLNDGSRYEAKTIGTDPSIDLALIKIDPKGKSLPVLTLGDSDQLRVGQWVLAIGNPLNFEHTVTAGVVSAKKRRVPIGTTDSAIANFIQTDAAINFGNSGGPLLDARGRVVGINTAISRANFAEGIGFALPINDARSAAEQLKETGSVKRGYIGITMNSSGLNDSARDYYGLPDSEGVIVQDVQDDGPAAQAGVRRGDVIRKVGDATVKDNQDLVASIASRKPGDRVRLELFRDGKTRDVTVVLGSRPDVGTLARNGRKGGPGGSAPGDDSEPSEAKGLGITVEPLTQALKQRWQFAPGVQGVVVSDVDIDAEAAERGIERDLVITSINDMPVTSVSEWRRIVHGLRVGAPVKIEVRVPGQEQSSYVFLKVPEAKD